MLDPAPRQAFPLTAAALIGAGAAAAIYLISGAGDLPDAGAIEHARALFWHAATGAATFALGAGWHNRTVPTASPLEALP